MSFSCLSKNARISSSSRAVARFLRSTSASFAFSISATVKG
ncbi:hypothetical protein AEGHOMDF_1022 [Methylobacterium soli]|nr:hypothetical protein AEGHOMDF_1022 [Methylobacterium soli]